MWLTLSMGLEGIFDRIRKGKGIYRAAIDYETVLERMDG